MGYAVYLESPVPAWRNHLDRPGSTAFSQRDKRGIVMTEGEEQVLSKAMDLEEAFISVYTKFKLYFYQRVLGNNFKSREATLTTVETFCMEVIYAMGRPTINEFASFINISSPNAAYKVNKLIQKGYVRKVQSEKDHREYHLEVTDKYLNYYNISQNYIDEVVGRLKYRLNEEEQDQLTRILNIMSEELMVEVPDFMRKEKPEGAEA